MIRKITNVETATHGVGAGSLVLAARSLDEDNEPNFFWSVTCSSGASAQFFFAVQALLRHVASAFVVARWLARATGLQGRPHGL